MQKTALEVYHNIPAYFREKVYRLFGGKGEAWLNSLPGILADCIDKWQLFDIKFAEDLSINLVLFARSRKFGEVVIKVEGPHPERYTEMKALELYNGRLACRCYDFDLEHAVLLLERIVPGTTLAELDDSARQVKIAVDLISRIPLPVPDSHGLPSYQDWLDRTFARARREQKVGSQMVAMIESAEQWFSDLGLANRQPMLLHADLHHWNILKCADGGWKAIDPHGVTGPAFMECCSFIANHLFLIAADRLSLLDSLITNFSCAFGEAKETVAKGCFIFHVLSTCWTFEEANPAPEQLTESVESCRLAYQYAKSIS